MEKARAIIDYASQDNGVAMRDALYSGIQDRVMAHIEAKKQEIALNLLKHPEEPELATAVDVNVNDN
jgi:hypothetical protein